MLRRECLDSAARMGEWLKTWQTEFKVAKCEMLHFCKKNPKADFCPNIVRLQMNKVQRDLDVIFHKPQAGTCNSGQEGNCTCWNNCYNYIGEPMPGVECNFWSLYPRGYISIGGSLKEIPQQNCLDESSQNELYSTAHKHRPFGISSSLLINYL